jgi:hypothetical protein
MRKNLRFLTYCTFILLLWACSKSSPTTAPIHIISLEENIPKLQEKAYEWQPDAHLVNAIIPIRINGDHVDPYLMVAFFESLSSDYESLIVRLYPDGEIESERVSHQKPIYQVRPITQQEWQFDSQEALDRLLDEDRTRLLKRSQLNCSELTLEYRKKTESSVIWILAIVDCGNLSAGSAVFYYLDPISGQVDQLIR